MRNKKRGAVTVEAGFSLTLFLLLFIGMVDVGMAFVHYHAMTENCRRALRWGVVNTYDSSKISNMAVYGNAEGTGSPLMGLDPSLVTVSMDTLNVSTFAISISIAKAPVTMISPWLGTFAPQVRASRIVESLGVT